MSALLRMFEMPGIYLLRLLCDKNIDVNTAGLAQGKSSKVAAHTEPRR